MKRRVACSEEGQELGKCLLEAEIFNSLADGNLEALSSSLSRREAQKECSTHGTWEHLCSD